MLLVAPRERRSGIRDAVAGHAVAVVTGLAVLAAFGLWNHPSTAQLMRDTWPQVGAQGLAVGITVLALALLGAHHPPAAATALLVTSGIARPGPPLYGMLAGLALLIVGAAAVARPADPG
jgi:hypothetical protein